MTYTRTVIRLLLGCTVVAVLLGTALAGTSSDSQPQSKPSPKLSPKLSPKPSLDALLLRVNSFWSVLEKKDKLRAMEYVIPSSRKNFLARSEPDISKPRVIEFALTGKPDEVQVTVTVKRFLPTVGTVDWPVHERWLFRNGNWFAVVAGAVPEFSGGTPGRPPASLTPQEMEQRRKEMQAALRFESQAVDFGTVRKGRNASFDLKYSLAGSDPVEVLFKDAPPELLVFGLEGGMLKPGDERSLPMQWMTGNSDGEVKTSFTLLARRHDVEVPFQIDIHGFVYTPVSSLPEQLIFQGDEQQKPLVVRNNSKLQVTIESFSSQTNSVLVQQLPVVLPPGGQVTLGVRTTLRISQKNYRDMLSLAFDRPIDGMASLIVPVVLNYEEPAEIKRVPGLGITQQEIEDLVKKAGQQPGKP